MTTVTQDLPINEGYISHSKVIRIKDIKLGDRFRKDLGDYEGLAESIREVGLLQPPVVNEDNELICGARRLEACAEFLHWKEIPVTVVPLTDILKGEFHENSHRKSFTTQETIEIKHELEKREAAEAKHRQSQAGKTYGRGKIASVDSTEAIDNNEECWSEPQDTRDKVAGYLGMSWNTLDKMEEIVKVAKEDPIEFGDLPDKIDCGKISVNKAFKNIKAKDKVETDTYGEQNLERQKNNILTRCRSLIKQYPDRRSETLTSLIEALQKELQA